jgi:glycerol 2-dehydrogenase (NADP+)
MIGNDPNFPKHPDGSRDLDTSITFIGTYKSMQNLMETGKVRAIGVCNFSVPYLEKLLAETTIVPAANQIENHPLLPQQEIVDYCKENKIHVTAYSPLGSTGSPLMKDEDVVKVAEKHGVGAANVLLSYHCKSSPTLSSRFSRDRSCC